MNELPAAFFKLCCDPEHWVSNEHSHFVLQMLKLKASSGKLFKTRVMVLNLKNNMLKKTSP